MLGNTQHICLEGNIYREVCVNQAKPQKEDLEGWMEGREEAHEGWDVYITVTDHVVV